MKVFRCTVNKISYIHYTVCVFFEVALCYTWTCTKKSQAKYDPTRIRFWRSIQIRIDSILIGKDSFKFIPSFPWFLLKGWQCLRCMLWICCGRFLQFLISFSLNFIHLFIAYSILFALHFSVWLQLRRTSKVKLSDAWKGHKQRLFGLRVVAFVVKFLMKKT